MNSKIGIVTVLYNSESVLEEFFESLENQTFKNFILYVVDNKSPDNSLNFTRKLAEKCSFKVEIIANDENFGVAKGNNIGIKQALNDNCDYILLSNNDVEFESDTINQLISELGELKADMVVPKIYVANTNLIWFADSKFMKRNGHNVHIGYLEEDKGQFNIKKKLDSAPTCFMLIRKEVFDKIGLMDENYFVYWDDTDFMYRAHKHNLNLWYIPTVSINHKEGSSTGTKSDFSVYYLHRNFVYFTLKNRSFFYAAYLLMVKLIMHMTKNLFTWDLHHWKIGFQAYFAGFKLYFNPTKL